MSGTLRPSSALRTPKTIHLGMTSAFFQTNFPAVLSDSVLYTGPLLYGFYLAHLPLTSSRTDDSFFLALDCFESYPIYFGDIRNILEAGVNIQNVIQTCLQNTHGIFSVDPSFQNTCYVDLISMLL